MNDSRTSLEVIAASPEEAIENGLTDLGLSEDEVEIEVLDPGSKGLFGIGSRQARVRLTIKQPGQEVYLPPLEPETMAEEFSDEEVEYADLGTQTSVSEKRAESQIEKITGMDDEDALDVARDTVNELLLAMKVRANVTAHFGTADDERGRVPLIVDVNGHDLSILIGPRAETLEALQYITNLIVGKELGRSIPLIVDVQGYRARREQQVRQLARRMAEQAVKSGRRQVLEPMPASERRLVHIELRDNPDVFTESIGEDPRRKVTIIPKP